MLILIGLLLMTLSPVLIPALISAFHAVANRRRNAREFVTVIHGPTSATDD